jgi:hypothetical protein
MLISDSVYFYNSFTILRAPCPDFDIYSVASWFVSLKRRFVEKDNTID